MLDSPSNSAESECIGFVGARNRMKIARKIRRSPTRPDCREGRSGARAVHPQRLTVSIMAVGPNASGNASPFRSSRRMLNAPRSTGIGRDSPPPFQQPRLPRSNLRIIWNKFVNPVLTRREPRQKGIEAESIPNWGQKPCIIPVGAGSPFARNRIADGRRVQRGWHNIA